MRTVTCVRLGGDPPLPSGGLSACVTGFAGVNDLGEGVNNLVEVIRLGEGVEVGLEDVIRLEGGVNGGLVGLSCLRGVDTGLVGVDSLRGVNIVLGGGLRCLGAESGSGLRVELVVCASFECSAP